MEAANRGAYEGASRRSGSTSNCLSSSTAIRIRTSRCAFATFLRAKVAFVKYAAAYVCLPGGFGTVDELSEALTPDADRQGKSMPLVLVGSRFWSEADRLDAQYAGDEA